MFDALFDPLTRAWKVVDTGLEGVGTGSKLIKAMEIGADVREGEREEVRALAREHVGREVRRRTSDLAEEARNLLAD